MAIICAGGLAALIAWSQARVTDQGEILIPCDIDGHLKDFKACVGRCPEVLEYDITEMPGTMYAKAKLVLRPGSVLPTIAPRS